MRNSRPFPVTSAMLAEDIDISDAANDLPLTLCRATRSSHRVFGGNPVIRCSNIFHWRYIVLRMMYGACSLTMEQRQRVLAFFFIYICKRHEVIRLNASLYLDVMKITPNVPYAVDIWGWAISAPHVDYEALVYNKCRYPHYMPEQPSWPIPSRRSRRRSRRLLGLRPMSA